MRLNPDLIRDLLIYLESYITNDNSATFDRLEPLPKALQKYSYDEFLYHVRQCDMMGYFVNTKYYDDGDSLFISDITPQAHEFLANIRLDSNWNEVKSKAKTVGSFSLNVLSQIAAALIAGKITS